MKREDSLEIKCGFGKFTPDWLQKFGHPNMFLCLFSFMGIIQSMYFTYFVGVLSTLQKRYNFSSTATGVILIADNVSHMLFSILVGHYCKHLHRPKLLTVGMMITVFSCFLSAFPYFIFGSKTLPPNSYTNEFKNSHLCVHDISNETYSNCNQDNLSEHNKALYIFIFASFLNGCGSLIYYTIGVTYLDDNVKKKNSPLYIGTSFASKLVGPTLGLWLSSVCLKYYEDPSINPGFLNNDPRWIGSWWVGFLLIGILLTVVSLPVALFPKRLRKSESFVSCKQEINHGLLISLKKLIKIPILLFHTLSITFQINGLFGYYTFMPKYMENQYGQTASEASFFSGNLALLTTMCSVFGGSFVMYKFKPKPKILIGYMLFVEIFAVIGFISAIFFGCDNPEIHGFPQKNNLNHNSCSSTCGCNENDFNPVCNEEHTIFYSPCFAGCNFFITENLTSVYFNCSCVPSLASNNNFSYLTENYCTSNCNKFFLYYVMLTICKLFAMTPKVGNVLITLRSVPEEEKVLTLSIVEFVISILATIPYPLIYGYVIDSTCLIWEENCDERGNCLLYDKTKFRNYIHTLSISFLFVGIVCELFVFHLSKSLTNFYDNSRESKFESNDELTSSHL